MFRPKKKKKKQKKKQQRYQAMQGMTEPSVTKKGKKKRPASTARVT
jgi:hypothetical protein